MRTLISAHSKHVAIWNDDASQIEMHLRSRVAQTVKIGEARFDFDPGETIHTENSRKFDLDQFLAFVAPTGWTLASSWLDENRFFAVILLRAID